MADAAGSSSRLGAFEGVFVPTALTILGVILYVRTSWVVGQVGLLGAWGVILGAYAISTATMLSLASIVTNVRIEAGGAFALLTRTLGIEPGGSIGLPLYLSQTLAITMYLFGFREGWLWVFPDHPAWAIDLGAFAVVFVLSAASARLAFRIQYVVIVVIAASLVVVGAALGTTETLQTPTWWLPGGEVGLAAAFAVFFPAVTGIMAGVNMSGDLARPRRAIIRGGLWAVGVTFVIYVAVAGIVAVLVPADTLEHSKTALIDGSAWSPMVLGGLLAATFSSALSTAVGAPRILEALAQHRVVPFGDTLERRWRGEPLAASLVTAGIAGLALLARDLNVIAPFITLIFLLTYGAINATLLVQQGLDLPRFRPSFRVPLVVPILGTLGCVAAMWIVSPIATVLAVATVLGVYAWLLRRSLSGPYGQVRAGIVQAAASWARGRLSAVPSQYAWQAHMLVPLLDPDRDRGVLPLVRELGRGGGSAMVLARSDGEGAEGPWVVDALSSAGLATRHVALSEEQPLSRLTHSLDLVTATLAPPGLLLVPLSAESPLLTDDDALPALLSSARRSGLGLWLAELPVAQDVEDDDIGEPELDAMTLWIEGVDSASAGDGALELLLVGAWRFARAWHPETAVIVCVEDEQACEPAREAALRTAERARLSGAEVRVTVEPLLEAIAEDDRHTLHLVVLAGAVSPDRVRSLREASGGRLVVGCLSGAARAD